MNKTKHTACGKNFQFSRNHATNLLSMKRVSLVSWIPPRKKLSLAAAEHLPRLDSEMLLLIEKKERELRKKINKLRADNKVPGRRNELKKTERPLLEKKFSVRRGFVDRLKVKVVFWPIVWDDSRPPKVYPGKGGDGNASFARGPNLRVAPPSGGDGGKGGSVIVEVDERISSLTAVPRLIRAGPGGNGGTNMRSGADGKDYVVRVPLGTQVSLIIPKQEEAQSEELGEEEQFKLRAKAKSFSLELLADLDHVGQRFVLAQGGKNGRGNASFQSSTNRSPREATKGVQPEVKK